MTFYDGPRSRAEGHIGWVEAGNALRAAEEQEWSRVTNEVVFTFGLDKAFECEDEDDYHAACEIAARDQISQLVDEIGIDLPVNAFVGDAGHGAGWATAGMTLVGLAVAGPAVANAWFDMARNTATVWRKVRGRKNRPMLSRGALIYLSIEDLRTRTEPDLPGVHLLQASDLGEHTVTHGGHDLTLILFASAEMSWLYLLDPYGHVVHFSEMGQPRSLLAYNVAWGTEAYKQEYPFLLEDGNDEPSNE
jgi:hypothetical protein